MGGQQWQQQWWWWQSPPPARPCCALLPCLLTGLLLGVAPAAAYIVLFTSSVAGYVVWAALSAFGIAMGLHLFVLAPLGALAATAWALVLWPRLEPTVLWAAGRSLHAPHVATRHAFSTLQCLAVAQAVGIANHLHPSATHLGVGDLGFVSRALEGTYRGAQQRGIGATRALLSQQRYLLALLHLAGERRSRAGGSGASGGGASGGASGAALSIRNPLATLRP